MCKYALRVSSYKNYCQRMCVFYFLFHFVDTINLNPTKPSDRHFPIDRTQPLKRSFFSAPVLIVLLLVLLKAIIEISVTSIMLMKMGWL